MSPCLVTPLISFVKSCLANASANSYYKVAWDFKFFCSHFIYRIHFIVFRFSFYLILFLVLKIIWRRLIFNIHAYWFLKFNSLNFILGTTSLNSQRNTMSSIFSFRFNFNGIYSAPSFSMQTLLNLFLKSVKVFIYRFVFGN